MKRIYLLIVCTIICTNYSCSKDEAETTTENPEPVILVPQITTINKDFFLEGEELIINGTNFISENQQTKLSFKNSVNNQEVLKDITPISNTEIRFTVTNDISIERNSVKIKIQNKESNLKDVFILPKGWYKINTYDNSTANILKSFVFTDTEEVFMNVKYSTNNGNSTSNYQSLKKLKTSYIGFENLDINGTYTSSFNMFNKSIGAFCSAFNTFSTSDGFNSVVQNNIFLPASGLMSAIDENYIYYFDEDTFLFYNIWDVQFLTEDSGNTFTNIPTPAVTSQEYFPNTNTIKSGPRVIYMQKSSNNKFYKIGYRLAKATTNSPLEYKNLILESDTGLDNWNLIDNTSEANIEAITKSKFISINNIYSISSENLVLSTDYMHSWVTIKPNVKYIALKNQDTWYIHENDAIYKTIDGGQNWTLELNLTPNAVINDISFSNNKIIISGQNGLLYIKHE
ncbi:hypothetical protein GOQ30_13230 [Flavobacterium sp. TP390]|uniref:IPT/TIG domain-containing protein n=1 Tax=Flavobacterium profundi TaxID=1774945 RepID=A0A6I4ITN0_9FLAO|nr:hypothetical protein [Flavobacterium profundi]MVO10128.1 hypothetical protein [Flavobacterium profundi]